MVPGARFRAYFQPRRARISLKYFEAATISVPETAASDSLMAKWNDSGAVSGL